MSPARCSPGRRRSSTITNRRIWIEGSLAILAEACEELGARALVCYGASERNFGREEARRGLAECRRLAASPLVRGLIGLHASFTVSDETAREAGALARELGTVVHVHLAEDQADVDDARRRGYPGPLERLLSLDALPEGSILAHGVRLSRDQVRLAADAGCWFVHNPRSNEGNRVGYAGALSAANASRVGRDGWDADMAAEDAALMRLAEQNGDVGVGGRLAMGARLSPSVSARKPSRWRPGRSAIWPCGEMALCATSSSAVASWSRTGFWRRLTTNPLRPRRAPKRRACGRAWRRSEASGGGRT